MVISFINYEIRVSIVKKDQEELHRHQQALKDQMERYAKTASFQSTMKAQDVHSFAQEKHAEPVAHADNKHV